MSLVEEISARDKQIRKRPSYLSDIVDIPETTKKNGRKSRSTTQNTKINYNLAALEATAHGLNQDDSEIITREERKTQKRLQELDRENYNEQHNTSRIELPKNLHQLQIQQQRTATVKRILNSKKQLNNYLDENESAQTKKIWAALEVSSDEQLQRNKLLICSICGNNSNYQCVRCATRYCSVKCGNLHNETRCATYAG